ncbi:MAG: hypothetical protein IKG88_03285 [Bacteroidales bacterium]|nr:hypothetical protein [Bacteroidales bacterium]
MDTLANKYAEILRTTHWEYYYGHPNMSIFEDDKCKLFIKSYLQEAGKTKTPILGYLNEISVNRTIHILSCFLLGILVYNGSRYIKKNIDKFMERIPTTRQASKQNQFLYIWMLVCLFHDFGYAVEENKKQITKQEILKLIKQMPTKIKGVPRLYSKKLLYRYNTYKYSRFKKFDHGIVGGVILYHDLCELRKVKNREKNDPLYWGKNLEKDYSVAAWAIACHNIFYDNGKSAYTSSYKQFGLEKLIILDDKGKYKIKIDRHPIFYLLCLVDSIEPIKTFKEFDALKEIELGFENNQVIIQVNSSCDSKLDEYFEKACGLNDWLTKTTKSGNTLTVNL